MDEPHTTPPGALKLPASINYVNVRDTTGRAFCQLWSPSTELARAAIIEAVGEHIAQGGGANGAPPLIIEIN